LAALRVTGTIDLSAVSAVLDAVSAKTSRHPEGSLWGACQVMPIREEEAVMYGLAVANSPDDLLSLTRLVLGSSVAHDFGSVAQDELAVKEFVADLVRLVRNRVADRRDVGDRLRYVYGLGFDPSMVAFPVVWTTEDAKGRTIRGVSYRVIAPTARRALGYVLSLLLDDGRSEGRRLRRCQLESCGRFFLREKPETGQASFRYCPRTDHQKRADRIKNLARVQAKRKRDRRKKAARKRR
jgi:hypothetical protein